MKKYIFLLGVSLGLLTTACDSQNTIENGYIETTQEGASIVTLKGYQNTSSGFSVFQPEGFYSPFYIKDKQFYGNVYRFVKTSSKRLDELKEIPLDAEWSSSAEIVEGASYWAWCASPVMYRFAKFRVADIDGNDVKIEYVLADTPLGGNLNANAAGEDATVTECEIPYLNDTCVYAAHQVTVDGNPILNYALEWNNAKRHANWVAFYFDATTSADVVKRTDAWAVDPKLPAEMQTQEADHKSDGFDKGHLCASEDRVYLKEANEQTFYYSNMSPQLNDFNGGFWAKLEARVQTWGRSTATGTYDRVYVTKGGTLNKLLVNFTGTPVSGGTPTTDENGLTVHGLACPQYYFMAVLSQKGDAYHAIGFLVPHKEGLNRNPSSDELKGYVVSIDELEKETGIDFFCNLPDAIESEVEAAYNVEDWAW